MVRQLTAISTIMCEELGYKQTVIEKPDTIEVVFEGAKAVSVMFDRKTLKIVGSVIVNFGSDNETRVNLTVDAFRDYFTPNSFKSIKQIEQSDKLEVGVGGYVKLYTDVIAYTVVKVINDKKIIVREDKAILSPDFKPDFVSGGFAGHCTNNQDQTYTFEQNENSVPQVFTLRKNGKWCAVGSNQNGTHLVIGKRKFFHDYNF